MGKRSNIDPRWDAAKKAEYRKELYEQKKFNNRQQYAKQKKQKQQEYLIEQVRLQMDRDADELARARGK